MELYFLRHAIAVERGNPQYKDDSLRPLTAQGQEKMHHAALGMRALSLKFDTILSSPYLRAKQTAEIVAQVYKVNTKKINLTDNLLEPAAIETLIKEIRTRFPNSKRVLCVGHEPHLTEMISKILKCSKPLPIDFKKGGLCSLSILGKQEIVLNWILTPSQLALMK